MELKTLNGQIYDHVIDAGFDACNDNGTDITKFHCSVDTGQGSIDITLYKRARPDVDIYHDNEGNDNECPNLCEHIAKNLPKFDEVIERWKADCIEDDPWQRNGFRDEADYLRYRYR